VNLQEIVYCLDNRIPPGYPDTGTAWARPALFETMVVPSFCATAGAGARLA